MKYYVYLILSKKYNKYTSYVGYTNDIEKGYIFTITQKELNSQEVKVGN